jgi:hypothetical protein
MKYTLTKILGFIAAVVLFVGCDPDDDSPTPIPTPTPTATTDSLPLGVYKKPGINNDSIIIYQTSNGTLRVKANSIGIDAAIKEDENKLWWDAHFDSIYNTNNLGEIRVYYFPEIDTCEIENPPPIPTQHYGLNGRYLEIHTNTDDHTFQPNVTTLMFGWGGVLINAQNPCGPYLEPYPYTFDYATLVHY